MELDQNNKLLSVIVAIYNKQKYLDKCIKSIVGQTRKNIEIILVDDGSDDESLEICEKYANEDKRIKLIKKKNEGQVVANKTALRWATGDYITFVDADDYIEPWLFEYEMDLFERYDMDMVCSGYIRENDKNSIQVTNSFKSGIYSREELESTVFPDMMFHREKIRHGIDASLCTKIFKRDILAPILENENESISLGEDIAVVYWYITQLSQ